MFDPFALPEDKVERAISFIVLGGLLTALTWSLAVMIWRAARRQGVRGLPGCLLLYLAIGPICIGVGLWEWFAPDLRTPDEKAVAEIQRLKGEFTRDESRPGRPVVKVSFRDSMVNQAWAGQHGLDDADLAGLEPYFQALTELQELDLVRANITDEGLQHLKGLTHLKTLQLGSNYGPNLISSQGVDELRKALPQTDILFYEPPGVPPLPPPLQAPLRPES